MPGKADLKEVIDAALERRKLYFKRTILFVTDISRWQEYGRAHGEFFAGHPPATTMVEVKALIDPHMLIEIEADAVCERG